MENKTKKKYNVEYENKIVLKDLIMTEVPYRIVEHYMHERQNDISFEEFRDQFKEIKKIISNSGPTQFLLEEDYIKGPEDTSNRRRKNYINSVRDLLQYKNLDKVTMFGVYTQWKNENDKSNFKKFISEISKLGYYVIECDTENDNNNLEEELFMNNDECGVRVNNLIKKIIKKQNIKISDLGITDDELDTKWFDMALLKNLPETCVGAKNSVSSNQSSIILSGKDYELFPVIKRSEFNEKTIGRHITVKLPVKIMSNNIKYLKEEDCSSENIVIETYITTNETTGNRVEIGTKTVDGNEYIEFYNKLYKDCKLLVLKIKGKLEYIIFAIREEDTEEYLGDLDLSKALTYFDFQTRINKPEQVTFVTNDDIEGVDVIKGENIIFYGAPGTGKSYEISAKCKKYKIKEEFIERVIFYDEYGHSDFVGCYMPCMAYVKDNTEYVGIDGEKVDIPGKPIPYYGFVEGPFTRALVKAKNNPDNNIILVIEELNRADAASVFGEVFQLLDRKSDGESKYEINISNEHSQYLAKEIDGYSAGQKIGIPKNLSIWATMNSADQGVKPLDTAFKRRWNFEYFKIDFDKAPHKDKTIKYGGGTITWKNFATTINKKLREKGINEDQHLGQFFIDEEEIKDNKKVASKILSYLFNDAAKHYRKDFFKDNQPLLSDLIEKFENNKILKLDFEIMELKHDGDKKLLEDGNNVDAQNSEQDNGYVEEKPESGSGIEG